MAAGAATGQAVVTRADRFENPYVGMSHSDHVAPCRQRLLCARQVPAEQLDQYQQEQIQHRIAGRSRQSDVEPKLLDGGRAYIVGGLSNLGRPSVSRKDATSGSLRRLTTFATLSISMASRTHRRSSRLGLRYCR